MRVLHVLNTSFFSGAENVVCQIIKMFENEIEMAYASPNGDIAETLKAKGVPFLPMKELSTSELRRVIQEYQPDILHGHDIKASFITSKFAKQYKVIHTIHSNDIRMRKMSVKSLLYKIAAKKAEHIFWVSKSCLEQYKYYQNVKEKSSVLVNIIHAQEAVERGKEEAEAFDVLYIGRLCLQKNPGRFVDVMAKVSKAYPSLRAAMLGKGSEEEVVRQKIQSYGLEEQVKVLGFERNPLRYLSKAKVLVLTSDWEGTPMVSLEAMALGIPIVSTPTDGMCDVVEEGKNGFLSAEEDVLSEKILLLLGDSNLWQNMQDAQREQSNRINDIASYKKSLREAYEI
ncbi:MAG: glycosyltransferase [Lachnospiraceae bacterium]|nr:glycosyltransferase [Lachnospiraceae bacterium]